MSHPPTDEQQAIIDAFGQGTPLVVEAGAGTGKTSTLKMLADAKPRLRGVYIAYNRSIAHDAQRSFPSWVTCKTAHAFAFGAVGRQFKHRLNGPRLPAQQAARILGINDPIKLCDLWLAPQQLAQVAMGTIGRFCYSDSETISPRHVPYVNGLDRAGQAELARYLAPIAQRAWDEDITRTNGQLRFQHDHYLKMWTLSRPQLPADYVLLDEAQDSNGCVAGLVTDQQAQHIWVGDRSQAIYGWRGATDAMEHASGRRLMLSQSFRFGPAIAAEANKWLELLDAPLRLAGHEPIASRLDGLAEPAAVLCRTNAGAITQVIAAGTAGRRAALVGGGDEIRRFAEAAEQLQAGRSTYHPDLLAFSRWSEVKAYVKESGESDLRVLVQLVDTHGPRGLVHIVEQLVDERNADVVVSTAHKAKGREWRTVRIAGDFQEPKPDEDGDYPELGRDECMLAYVAVTRAQEVLDRDGLAWVDRFVDPPTVSPEPEPGPSATSQVDPFELAASEPAELRRFNELIEASSLGTPHARQLRHDASAAGELTGVEPEQADWDDPADLVPAGWVSPPYAADGNHVWIADDDQTGCHPDYRPGEDDPDARRLLTAVAGLPPEATDAQLDQALRVPHCYRCGSDACLCDPAAAAAFRAHQDVPAGPRPAREAWARARMAGAR